MHNSIVEDAYTAAPVPCTSSIPARRLSASYLHDEIYTTFRSQKGQSQQDSKAAEYAEALDNLNKKEDSEIAIVFRASHQDGDTSRGSNNEGY